MIFFLFFQQECGSSLAAKYRLDFTSIVGCRHHSSSMLGCCNSEELADFINKFINLKIQLLTRDLLKILHLHRHQRAAQPLEVTFPLCQTVVEDGRISAFRKKREKEIEKQPVEGKTWESLGTCSLFERMQKSTNLHTHKHRYTHLHVRLRTHVSTQWGTRATRVHAHTHTASLPQLHSAHVWNEQGSYLLETHHWARGEVARGRHTQQEEEEGGEQIGVEGRG